MSRIHYKAIIDRSCADLEFELDGVPIIQGNPVNGKDPIVDVFKEMMLAVNEKAIELHKNQLETDGEVEEEFEEIDGLDGNKILVNKNLELKLETQNKSNPMFG